MVEFYDKIKVDNKSFSIIEHYYRIDQSWTSSNIFSHDYQILKAEHSDGESKIEAFKNKKGKIKVCFEGERSRGEVPKWKKFLGIYSPKEGILTSLISTILKEEEDETDDVG